MEKQKNTGRARLHNEIKKLLEYAPKVDTLLDIGFGDGELSVYFSNKGTKVTAGGINVLGYKERYATNFTRLEKKGIEIVECNVEDMPFAEESFDAVLASHILEHVNNMGVALQEIRRVLKRDGWLFVFIPRFSEMVIDDHVNTGYNLGQLIYILALHGFDARNGMFIHYGYSLCAFVQKSEEVPKLQTLYPIQEMKEKKLLPENVIRSLKYPNKSEVMAGHKEGVAIGYNGNFEYLNFPNARHLLREYNRKYSEEEKLKKGLVTIIEEFGKKWYLRHKR